MVLDYRVYQRIQADPEHQGTLEDQLDLGYHSVLGFQIVQWDRLVLQLLADPVVLDFLADPSVLLHHWYQLDHQVP